MLTFVWALKSTLANWFPSRWRVVTKVFLLKSTLVNWLLFRYRVVNCVKPLTSTLVNAWLDRVRLVRFVTFDRSMAEIFEPDTDPIASNEVNCPGAAYRVTVPSPDTVPVTVVAQSTSGSEAIFSYGFNWPSPQSTFNVCDGSAK